MSIDICTHAASGARSTDAGESAPQPPARWTAHGIVVDTEGRPSAGLAVVALPAGSHALAQPEWAAAAERARGGRRTGAGGRFELEVEVETPLALVFVHDTTWTTLFAGYTGAHASAEDTIVVVTRAVRCAGHVVDNTGLLIPGATLSTDDELAPSLPGFPLPLARSVRVAWTWRTDRAGAFDLSGLGHVARRRIDVAREGYNRTTFWPANEDRFDWLVVMQLVPEPPPGGFELRSEPLLFGFVRDRDGAPIEAARVMLCAQESTTDRTGRFELERPGWVPNGVALVARAPDGRVALTDPELDLTLLEVRVDRLMLVQVDARGSDPVPTSVSFLDEHDRTVQANHPGGGHSTLSMVELHEGRSGVVGVATSARTAVLARDGVEIARVAIEPSVERVTLVRGP